MAKAPEKVQGVEFQRIKIQDPTLSAVVGTLRFIGGLKFGLTLLFLLIVASSIGEFLPQGDEKNPVNFAFEYVFRTWWYRTLLVMQGINLCINTILTYIDETSVQFLPIFRARPDDFKPLKIKHRASFKETGVAAGEGMMKSLAEALHKRGYRAFFDGTSLYAHRGLFARFGSTITHLGLITIIAGATIESVFKVESDVTIVEGETVSKYRLKGDAEDEPPKRPFGFSIHLPDFEFTEYPGTSTASKYKSTLTLEGKSPGPVHDYVRVNHSIKYGGWILHQNSYVPPDESAPYKLSQYLASQNRYFVKLAGKTGDGKPTEHAFEILVPPQGREVLPIPGEADRFFSAEADSTGKGVIWTVASADKVLARGAKSTFGDLKIELLRFYSDFAMDSERGPINQSDEVRKPAAVIEISAENRIIDYVWAFQKGSAEAQAPPVKEKSLIDFVITNVEVAPEVATGAGPSIPAGKPDGAMLASPAASPAAKTLEDRAVVTIALKNRETGEPTGAQYTLTKGKGVPLATAPDAGFDIAGDYDLKVLQRIPTYATVLSISKNPGVPIVWLGAILASFGPVVAFFVSRRRIWAHLEPEKKTLWIGGESRYSREALEDELAVTLKSWSESSEVRMNPPIAMNLPEGEREVLSRYL